MKLYKIFIIIGMIFWLAGCAGSRSAVDYETALVLPQPNPTQEAASDFAQIDLTVALADLLAYAALNNPGLKAAFYRWQAEIGKIAQAKALPDPKVSYAYFIREVETRVGPQRQKIGLSQTFPWFGKLGLRSEIATEAANAAKARFDGEKLQLFYVVKDAWFEYAYLFRAIDIFQENVQLMGLLENVVRTKYRSGLVPHTNLINIQIELDKLNDRLKDLADLKQPLQAQLNTALNRSADAALPPPGRLAMPDTLAKNIAAKRGDWAEKLKAKNPALQASRFMIEKEKAGISLAKKNALPDVTLGVDYIDTGEALMPDAADSGKNPLVTMLSLNIPIWQGKNKAAVNEAKARHLAAINDYQSRENQLNAKLEKTLYRFREAERKIMLYTQSLIPRSEQAFNVAKTAYEAGEIDFPELIGAQRALLEFRLMLERKKANYWQRFAELEMITGSELH